MLVIVSLVLKVWSGIEWRVWFLVGVFDFC